MKAAPASPDIRAAYSHCEKLAREHYENFPVASMLLPSPMRPHVAAIYAFARTADDFADEPGRSPAERLRLLDDWQARLDRAAAHQTTDHPVFAALTHTIHSCDLPVHLLSDLLSAFRQDVTVRRYQTWADVLDYCRRSANPVGRLVLWIAGVRNERAALASDAVCTALQLTNFWQDLGIDWRNGRLYVPVEEQRKAGALETNLDAPALSPPWIAAMRASVERTRGLFVQGRPVADEVRGRLRFELRATWHGGMRILEKIEAQNYDTLNRRPRLARADALLVLARTLRWRAGTTARIGAEGTIASR